VVPSFLLKWWTNGWHLSSVSSLPLCLYQCHPLLWLQFILWSQHYPAFSLWMCLRLGTPTHRQLSCEMEAILWRVTLEVCIRRFFFGGLHILEHVGSFKSFLSSRNQFKFQSNSGAGHHSSLLGCRPASFMECNRTEQFKTWKCQRNLTHSKNFGSVGLGQKLAPSFSDLCVLVWMSMCFLL
jgi:hypothetical protein